MSLQEALQESGETTVTELCDALKRYVDKIAEVQFNQTIVLEQLSKCVLDLQQTKEDKKNVE